jgi:hypothetical protein
VDENPVDQPSTPPSIEPLEEATLGDRHNLEVIVAQVVKEFDPNHQLPELTSSWAGFMAGAVTFDKNFQINTGQIYSICIYECLIQLRNIYLLNRPIGNAWKRNSMPTP